MRRGAAVCRRFPAKDAASLQHKPLGGVSVLHQHLGLSKAKGHDRPALPGIRPIPFAVGCDADLAIPPQFRQHPVEQRFRNPQIPVKRVNLLIKKQLFLLKSD